HQVGVLLVGQRLDRGGVEALATVTQRQVDSELSHDGLSGTGGCGDQHPMPRLQGFAGPDLEVVEVEPVEILELLDGGAGLLLSPAELGVAGGISAHTGQPRGWEGQRVVFFYSPWLADGHTRQDRSYRFSGRSPCAPSRGGPRRPAGARRDVPRRRGRRRRRPR